MDITGGSGGVTPRFGSRGSAAVVLVLAVLSRKSSWGAVLTLQSVTVAPHWASADPGGGVMPGDKAAAHF